jgi:predicted phosphodiesterase
MRIALFSDVHGNLEALTRVLDHIRQRKTDRVFCLGDIAGYGPDLNGCIRALQSTPQLTCLKGNHDAALLGDDNCYSQMNEYAQRAIEIQKTSAGPKEPAFLEKLELLYQWDAMAFAHASYRSPLTEYLMSPSKIKENLEMLEGDVCFGGHTHHPLTYSWSPDDKETIHVPDGEGHVQNEERFVYRLPAKGKHWINVGSVGQPRDGDWRTCLVYFDVEKREVEFVRLSYDVAATQKKLRSAGFPEFLAQRLLEGR